MVSSASIINQVSCLSEVSTIPYGDKAVVSFDNEILFSLVTFFSSTLFEVSIIDILLPNLSNLVLMVEFFIFFFILVCNYFSRQIICFPIFSLLSFKIKFSLFFQNRRFFALPISINSSLVSFENYYGVNLETTLDK